MTLEARKKEITTSIHGRKLGLDLDGWLIGKGWRQAITAATSDTTGTAIPNHGIVSVETSTNDTWTLSAPEPGCQVHLTTISTSTGVRTISSATAIVSTNGITGSAVSLSNRGAYVTLVGMSTSLWAVASRASTAVAEITS